MLIRLEDDGKCCVSVATFAVVALHVVVIVPRRLHVTAAACDRRLTWKDAKGCRRTADVLEIFS